MGEAMIQKIKWAIIGWLIKPRIERDRLGRLHFGPLLIVPTPIDCTKVSHDAIRAFHCDGYSFLFYKDIKEWFP